MKVGLIAPDDVTTVWLLAAPHLEKSVPHSGGRYTLEDMYKQLLSGEQHLWLVSDKPGQTVAAFTTRVLTYPSLKVLSCQFCGGLNRMDEWIDAVDDILNRFAADAGCTAIEMTGRPGWTRKLPELWFEEYRTYRRPVTDASISARPPPA